MAGKIIRKRTHCKRRKRFWFDAGENLHQSGAIRNCTWPGMVVPIISLTELRQKRWNFKMINNESEGHYSNIWYYIFIYVFIWSPLMSCSRIIHWYKGALYYGQYKPGRDRWTRRLVTTRQCDGIGKMPLCHCAMLTMEPTESRRPCHDNLNFNALFKFSVCA